MFPIPFNYDITNLKESILIKQTYLINNLKYDKIINNMKCVKIRKKCHKKGGYIYPIISGFNIYNKENKATPLSVLLLKSFSDNNFIYICPYIKDSAGNQYFTTNDNNVNSFLYITVFYICR